MTERPTKAEVATHAFRREWLRDPVIQSKYLPPDLPANPIHLTNNEVVPRLTYTEIVALVDEGYLMPEPPGSVGDPLARYKITAFAREQRAKGLGV